ncbi:MAG TPA: hypothetical protein VMU16_07375 [Candidatus Binataceae bacterium]|nr:hypothetical protein [Candidatus Binataceae bacterium]
MSRKETDNVIASEMADRLRTLSAARLKACGSAEKVAQALSLPLCDKNPSGIPSKNAATIREIHNARVVLFGIVNPFVDYTATFSSIANSINSETVQI